MIVTMTNLPPDVLKKLIKLFPKDITPKLEPTDIHESGRLVGHNQARTKAITALPAILSVYNQWLIEEKSKRSVFSPRYGNVCS